MGFFWTSDLIQLSLPKICHDGVAHINRSRCWCCYCMVRLFCPPHIELSSECIEAASGATDLSGSSAAAGRFNRMAGFLPTIFSWSKSWEFLFAFPLQGGLQWQRI